MSMVLKKDNVLFFVILSSVLLQTIGNSDYGNEYLVVLLLLYFSLFKTWFKKSFVLTVLFFSASLVYSCMISSNVLAAITRDFFTEMKPYFIATLCSVSVICLSKKKSNTLFAVFFTGMLLNGCLFILGISEKVYSTEGNTATENWQLAGSSTILFFFSLLFLEEDKRNKYIILLIFLSFGAWASGQSKHAAFWVVSMTSILYFVFFYGERQLKKEVRVRGIIIYILVCLALICSVFAWEIVHDDVEYYYLRETSSLRSSIARKEFLRNIPDVLSGGFVVFGRGLATYGSQSSGIYYSSLYYELGMNKVYGLRPGATMFVNDAYYATFLGQFGIAGVIFQFFFWKYMLSPFLVCFRRKINIPPKYFLIGILAFLWSIIFIAGSGLMNSQGCFVMCCLGFARGGIVQYFHNAKKREGFEVLGEQLKGV